MSIYIRSKHSLADLTLMCIHEKQVGTMQERYQVNLKEHPLKYFWLLLISSSFICSMNANCFKWYFLPSNTDKLENVFPLFLLFWQVCNIRQKITNNLGAMPYTYMNVHKFTVLTFQSKRTQSCSTLETKQQATSSATNVATGFWSQAMLLLASFLAEANKLKSL